MLSHPKPGQTVQVWYRKALAPTRPLHGQVGAVVVASRGRPRNHGVLIGGEMHVIPAGNLRRLEGRADQHGRD